MGGSEGLAREFPPDVRRELDMEGRTIVTRHLVKVGLHLLVGSDRSNQTAYCEQDDLICSRRMARPWW